MGIPFRIYNTRTRSVEDFKPTTEGKVGIYVCGMTVYDRCHMGHARAMVVFDAFVRYLRFRGWDVNFVRNFTDVDDKIITRANELGEDPIALSARFIEAFHEDADAMGLIRPDEEPRVSESIDSILQLTQSLIEKGSAYESEGSVWFDVKSFPAYGQLSGQKVDELKSPDVVPGKRHPADFALWKGVKPGEPAWDSPWGPGRPGWHIECSAMAMDCIGHTLDIHGGGLDLVFPHHENEIAQSEAHSDCTYANYWMHNGMLTMSGGQKMGKSLGNVWNVQNALKEFPAECLRLYYLQSLYRSSLPWHDEALPEALGMLCRLYEAREVAESMGGSEDAAQVAKDLGEDAMKVIEIAESFESRFLSALDEDFNTAKAMAVVFELARAINRFANHKKAKKRGGPVVAGALAAFQLVSDTLAILSLDVSAFMEEVKTKRCAAMGLNPEQVSETIAARSQARNDREWATADAIRVDLDEKGVILMDNPDGTTTWRLRITDAS
ncbi:MAG: cysteine--tRNA ligase [Deltaproteobacteria bacterium]|nr:cysteine--tRNA ligase [Deltaproteobacteria bacterium]